jgi:hypothetical protein
VVEEIIEPFSPVLNNDSQERFNQLIYNLAQAYPNYTGELVRRELGALKNITENLEVLKYKAALSALYDLAQQGWNIEIKDGNVLLRMAEDASMDKAHVRYRLDSERRAQFQDESVQRFIAGMEREKLHNGSKISIKALIGDSKHLLTAIRKKSEVLVQPYIQLVKHERDEYTGYYDADIWRYFRYTWSIPYKTMPGRNLFYLVRDAAQPYHPIVGIFALGNSVLNLTVRDNEIGWTVDAIKKNMKRKESGEVFDNKVRGTNGFVKAKVTTYLESEEQHQTRIQSYAETIIQVLSDTLHTAINDIYVKDLNYHKNTRYPSEKKINELKELYEALRGKVIDNKKTVHVTDWEAEALEPLFCKKRAAELARLLDAQRIFNESKKTSRTEWLAELLRTESGRKAVNTALIANRKTKIGSNVMEIIVCGAIPPYNDLLGGKLISLLACSPAVIRDYTKKYERHISEIASRMKGKKVVRDSHLAYLGTTSLYALGSSQYNRIKVPMTEDFVLQFKKMGVTEGYGSIYFSKQTTSLMMRILELQDGGRKINNVFGEGTSPRFRLISRGLSAIGIRADAFLQHYSPRIVYSIELARNTNKFLLGLAKHLDYPFDIENNDSVEQATQKLIAFWQKRWLNMRLTSVNIEERLSAFEPEQILVSYMR